MMLLSVAIVFAHFQSLCDSKIKIIIFLGT